MVRARWSVRLEGDGVLDLRVHRATGHLLVVTSKVTFRRAGQKRLTVDEFAPPTPGESVLITKNGAIAARRSAAGAWRLLDSVNAGDAAPSFAEVVEVGDSAESLRGCGVRIGSVDYSLTDGALSRYARDGELLSSVALPMDPLIAAMQQSGPAAVGRFEHSSHHLKQTQPIAYDERRNRIIAWAWSLPGWVMAVGLDGAIEWVTVPTIECCNFVCLLPREDVIVHLSGCGNRVTFISGDGATRGVRRFEASPTSIYPDCEGGVVVTFVGGGMAGFDALGTQKWTLDCPRVERAIVEAGVIYAVVSPGPGRLEASAFELEHI